MATALTKFASFFRPIGKGSDEVVAIKLHPKAVTVAEVRFNANVINIDNLASAGLPRQVDIHNLARTQDMVVDTLRTMHGRDMFAAQDAGIIIPSGVVTLRQINLPFMAPAELAKETRDISFWQDVEPDIGKLEDPFITYHTLVSSENDDLTRVVVGFAEMATLRPWSDLLLAAHLNPVYIELEPVALANFLYASLSREEKRQSQAILHITQNRIEVIAFQPSKFQTVKLEISEFDHVLLTEIEDIEDPTGEFWDEVGARTGNTLKQAILFLQEEQDFPPFSVIHVAVDALRARNIMTLLDRGFTLAPITLWDPTMRAQLSQPVTQLLSKAGNTSGFGSAFGLGLRRLGTFGEADRGLIHLSMLPYADTLRRNRQMGVISRSLLKAWVMVAIIMAGWTFGLVMPAFLESKSQSRGIEDIKLSAATAQQQLQSAEEVVGIREQELMAVSDIGMARGKLTIMDTLPDLLPEGLELSSYKLTDSNNLTISGSAVSEAAVFTFMTELINSGLVANPSTTPSPREESIFYDFTLTGTLKQEQ
jgi:Tfp pilus assembly protein PilN